MSILPCDRCGQCGCQCGALPYTITATFSGLKNKTHSEHCSLTITSDFGSGAKAVALSPGGDSKGPMTAALVTEGGCGYAKLGHVEPALTISGGSGTGATFTPTLEVINASQNPSCYVWQLKSVEMDGGTGYALGEYLTITANDNAFEVAPAVAKLAFGRKEPEIKATASGGSGAELKVSLSQPIGAPKTWSVESVSVKAGGNGYKEGSAVTFSYAPDDTEVTAAEATISTKHAAPTLSASTFSYSGGTGATFGAPVLVTDDNEYWRVQSVPVISAGSGYYRGEAIQITVVDGEEVRAAFVAVQETTDPGGFGGIVRVEPYSDYGGGEYFKDTGIIASVSVTDPGEYYGETGTPGSVDVVSGGGYYKESKAAPPCVAKVTVANNCPGAGDQPLSATIDTKVSSDTFGEITGIKIEGAGTYNQSFQAWTWQDSGSESFNNVPTTLAASSPKKLVTVTLESCFGAGACASVLAVGDREEPEIKLVAGCEPAAACEECKGGDISVTLAEQKDDDGLPYWSVTKVSASGGSGYSDSSQAKIATAQSPCLVIDEPIDVTITAIDGVLSDATINNGGKFWNQLKYDGLPGPIRKVQLGQGGSGYALLGREEPSLNISPSGASFGTGASFTPSFSQHKDECGVDFWKIASVSVSGGTCFNINGRTQPSLAASVAGGDGISLQVSTAPSSDSCGGMCWRVEGISAVGGSGYENDSDILIYPTNDAVVRTAAKATLQTDKNGSPIGVSIREAGEYFVRGPDEPLAVSLATEDDKQAEEPQLTIQADDDGVPTGVTVVRSGAFYRENKSLPPYVADVTVKLVQLAPSNGSGAELSVEVDEDTQGGAFGAIKAIKIDDPGSGYEILGAPYDCKYTDSGCKGDHNYSVSLQFRGRGKTPLLSLSPGAVFEGDDPLDDCDTLPTSASLLYGAESGTVELSRGGAVVTDCAPQGYCAGSALCDIHSLAPGCPTIRAVGSVTINGPQQQPQFGGWCAQGTYPFDFELTLTSVVGGQCNLNLPFACFYQGFQAFPANVGQNDGSASAQGNGEAYVNFICRGDRWSTWGSVDTQFACAINNFFSGVAPSDNDIAVNGTIPIEWIGDTPRPKSGSHSVSYVFPLNLGSIEYTLTITY